MIKTILRSVLCFCAAVVLLALLVCAVEVGCRAWQFSASLNPGVAEFRTENLIIPSSKSWTEVRPLIDIEHTIPNGGSVRIRTNELGLRGPSITVPKPDGVFRILCLGGTGIFGTDVPEGDTLSTALQRCLIQQSGAEIEVINGGCPQTGPLAQVLRYRAGLQSLQADLVVLCISIEDLTHDTDVRKALRLDRYRQPAYAAHPGALLRNTNLAEEARNDFLCLSWTMDLITRTLVNRNQRPFFIPQEGGFGRRELGVIASLSKMVEANQGMLIVSASPSAWGLEQTRSAMMHQRPTFGDDINRILHELQVADRIPIHDVLPDFCGLPDPRSAFSSRAGCLTASGNDLYARSLAVYLMNRAPNLAHFLSSPRATQSSVIPASDQRLTPLNSQSTPLPATTPPH
ncbi:hypothetical protein [Planctomicrobium sp. SH527]|uniref:hypothetical protein n=1 Tax=Planctomicrobium sp. SH527 TaxID=3448123 RepID=UPI003F5C5A78